MIERHLSTEAGNLTRMRYNIYMMEFYVHYCYHVVSSLLIQTSMPRNPRGQYQSVGQCQSVLSLMMHCQLIMGECWNRTKAGREKNRLLVGSGKSESPAMAFIGCSLAPLVTEVSWGSARDD